MEMKDISNRLRKNLNKYKYLLLILAIGFLLMSIPSKSTERKKENTAETHPVSESVTTEETLSHILSCIEGAGEVKVMLTRSKGEETLYQEDREDSSDENSQDRKTDTVIVSDDNRKQQGLIKQVNPPVYLGAIIVCSGGNDPNVRLAVVDAVSKVTGLGADQISVLKMK